MSKQWNYVENYNFIRREKLKGHTQQKLNVGDGQIKPVKECYFW